MTQQEVNRSSDLCRRCLKEDQVGVQEGVAAACDVLSEMTLKKLEEFLNPGDALTLFGWCFMSCSVVY